MDELMVRRRSAPGAFAKPAQVERTLHFRSSPDTLLAFAIDCYNLLRGNREPAI